MIPAPESTPHENTMIYDSAFERAQQIVRIAPPDSIDTASRQTFAHLQTGLEIPLRSASALHPVNHSMAEDCFTQWKRILDSPFRRRRDIIDGDKDKNKELFGIDVEIYHQQLQRQRRRVVDKKRKARVRGNWKAWGPWPTSAVEGRPSSYTVQPANPGENPWTNWTKEA